MRRYGRWFCAAGIALLVAGCGNPNKVPKYIANFEQVRPGMSKSQVSKLLGLPALVSTYPDSQVRVAVPNPDDAWSGLRQDVDAIFADGELWQYGKYSLGDLAEPPELLGGSPKSFAVWFDVRGHVVRARKPLLGPYADPHQQPPHTPSASELWEGDAFGRDKAHVGPTTQP
jgi:hypothetical protein